MNDIMTTTSHLPANFGDSLMAGIDETRSTINATGGKPFFKLKKSGVFVFGAKDEEMQKGSRWAVNCASLQRGWVCWGKGSAQGTLLGQVMASINAPQLPRPAPVNGHDYEEQFGFEMVCLNGDDAGQPVLYKSNSYGYKQAYDQLLADIRARWSVDQTSYWPIITLRAEPYDHKQYGEIFNPIFTVVAWADAEGNIAGQTVPKIEKPVEAAVAAPAPEPKRQRKAPLTEATEFRSSAQVEAASDEPAPAPVGQRRRPAAR